MDRQEMSCLEMECCDPNFRRSGPEYFARTSSIGERMGAGNRATAATRAFSHRTTDSGMEDVPCVHSRTISSRQRSWFANAGSVPVKDNHAVAQVGWGHGSIRDMSCLSSARHTVRIGMVTDL